ncbi:hypothetical protein EAY01_22685, partial [Vibrio anguillarum]|nr:hypothetical protein [Vibrio anguillarum]
KHRWVTIQKSILEVKENNDTRGRHFHDREVKRNNDVLFSSNPFRFRQPKVYERSLKANFHGLGVSLF